MKLQLQTVLLALSLLAEFPSTTLAHGGDHGHLNARGTLVKRRFEVPEELKFKTSGQYHHSTSDTAKKVRRALGKRSTKDPLDVVKAYVEEVAPGSEYTIDSMYTDKDTGTTHVFIVQVVGGLIVANARGNVNIDKNGNIFSSGISFTKKTSVRRRRRERELNPLEALDGALEALGLGDDLDHPEAGIVPVTSIKPLNAGDAKYKIENFNSVHREPEAKLAYLQNEEGELTLVWDIDYDGVNGNMLGIYTDAVEKKKVHRVADLSSDADKQPKPSSSSYLVYKFGLNDPTEGKRTLEKDPFKKKESPMGWHTIKSGKFTTTRGNNAMAIVNREGDLVTPFDKLYSPDGKSELKFEFPYDEKERDLTKIVDAAATQLFYTTNMYHDLLEQLGFTEAAGNFEENPAEGLGNDGPSLHVQFGIETGNEEYKNNANFATPRDGLRPRMIMYVWDSPSGTGPDLDCSFDAGIVIHEYTHGLSNRLTGGPMNSECLQTDESGGMGEGWSDFFATAVRLKKGDKRTKDYAMGAWVNDAKAQKGIRQYSYSTDMKTNPLVYEQLNIPAWATVVHASGTVWASMLYEVLWNIVDAYGGEVQEEIFPQFDEKTKLPKDGRNMAMKIVLEAMKLQPCNPTFLDARDAIIDADIQLTQGKNFCTLWTAFAKRGLGYDAKQSTDLQKKTNGFKVHPDCEGGNKTEDKPKDRPHENEEVEEEEEKEEEEEVEEEELPWEEEEDLISI